MTRLGSAAVATRWTGDAMSSADGRYAALLARAVDAEGAEETAAVAREARSLGTTLAEMGVRASALLELHATALRQLGAEHADARLDLAAPRLAEVALEVGRAHAAEERARSSGDGGPFAREEFVALFAHELRGALSPILTWAELLRSEDGADAREEGALGAMERNARVIQAMVDDLSVVAARSSSAELRARPRVELGAVVDHVVTTFREEAARKGVPLDLACAEPSWVEGDARRLRQMVRNLVANAVKFTPVGGRVDIRLTNAGATVRLEVRDSGPGLGAVELSRLFALRGAAPGATPRRHRGLGLGLVAVHRLIHEHGGNIRVESRGPGQGAVFRVELPGAGRAALARQPGGTPAEEPSRPDPRRLAGVRILVVDDEPDALEVARRLLALRGAAVETAGSAEEALAALAASPAELVVSDLAMPRHDGYAFIVAVREREAETGSPRVPAVALTAHSRELERRKALAAGFDAVVAKPIESAELLETLGILLDTR